MSETGKHSSPSCPGLTRASTTFAAAEEDVDGRDKPGHDSGGRGRRRFFRIAVSPGKYVLPQAYVEDMYNPSRYGRTGTGAVEVRAAK